MKGRFSRQPFASSVARICSGLRTSTQSPAFRFRFLDGFELFSTWDCISPSLDFDLDWLRAPLSVAQNHRAPIPKAPGTTPSTNGQTGSDTCSSWSELFNEGCEEYSNPDIKGRSKKHAQDLECRLRSPLSHPP